MATKEQIREHKIKEASVQLARLGCTPEQIAKHLESLQPKPPRRKRPRNGKRFQPPDSLQCKTTR